jgi:hypothetical protein
MGLMVVKAIKHVRHNARTFELTPRELGQNTVDSVQTAMLFRFGAIAILLIFGMLEGCMEVIAVL